MITAFAWTEATQAGAWSDAPPEKGQEADVLWIDLEAPTQEEEKFVFEGPSPSPPPPREAIPRPRPQPDEPPHFPKVEEFKDYLFVIVTPLTPRAAEILTRTGPEAAPGALVQQLSAVLNHRVLITHHYEP